MMFSRIYEKNRKCARLVAAVENRCTTASLLVIVDRTLPRSMGVENPGNPKSGSNGSERVDIATSVAIEEEDPVFAERCSYSWSLFCRPDLRAIPPLRLQKSSFR
ncbi:hypothetical protein MTO96_037593 [Rhipicephalus appendiculatus]